MHASVRSRRTAVASPSGSGSALMGRRPAAKWDASAARAALRGPKKKVGPISAASARPSSGLARTRKTSAPAVAGGSATQQVPRAKKPTADPAGGELQDLDAGLKGKIHRVDPTCAS